MYYSAMPQMPQKLARRLNWKMMDERGKQQRAKGKQELKRDTRVALEWAIRERYDGPLGFGAFSWTSACTPALVRAVVGSAAAPVSQVSHVRCCIWMARMLRSRDLTRKCPGYMTSSPVTIPTSASACFIFDFD